MIWKIVPNFTKYEASNAGKIRDKITKQIIEKFYAFRNPKNYYTVRVIDDSGENKLMYLHRMICSAFHGDKTTNDQGDRYVVDHIDGNKHNNKSSNLRWVTHSENMILAMKNNLRNDNIEITIHDTVTDEKTTYYSIIEASRVLNIARSSLYAYLYLFSGKRLFMNRFRLSYNKEKLGAVIRKSTPCWIYNIISSHWEKYDSSTEAALNTGILPGTIRSKLSKKSHAPFCGYIISNTKLTNLPNYSKSEAMNERKKLYRYSTNPVTVYLVYDKITNENLVARNLKEACDFAKLQADRNYVYDTLKSKLGTTKPWIAISKVIL